ncbi:MAG: DUF1736 domain-containing protein [Planctomycetes bacterium]|nr:DUF1736 domain-containing protein [Planctomycetota bacterium]
MPDASAARRDRVPLAAILLLTAAIYAPSAWNGFTYDDAFYVQAETTGGPNVMVRELQPLGDYFRRPYGYPQARHGRGFRPATVYSFALTHHVFSQSRGPSSERTDPAWPHHALNVLLHVLGTWLVYRIMRRFTGPGLPPLLAALVFGVHTLRSDTVIAIVGRGEILAFVAGAGALELYLEGLARTRRRAWFFAPAALLLFLALSSKENALGWAALLPAFGAVALRRADPAASLAAALRRQALAFVLVAGPPVALFVILRHQMLLEHGQRFLVTFNANPLYHEAAAVRMMTGAMLLGYGLWKMVAPFSLACDYGVYVFRLVHSALDPRFLGAVAALAVLAAGGALAFRRHGLLFLAVAVFLVFGLITSNTPVAIETIFAERLYYLPALGLSLAVAWLAARIATRRRAHAALLLATGAWSIAAGALCVKRCFDWRSMESLVLADVDAQPRSLFLNLEAAGIHARRGDARERDRYLERAERLDPESPWISLALGQHRLRAGNLAEAARLLSRALDSDRLDAGERPYLHQNLGAIQLRLGRRDEARRHFEALRASDAGPALTHLARVSLLWIAHGDGDTEATAALLAEGRRALAGIETDPERAEAAAEYDLFGGLLAHRRGDFEAAVRELGAALGMLETRRMDPERTPAVLAYIDALARTGRTAAARQMVDCYLRSPHLAADHRPEFEALSRRLGQ